MAHLRDGLAESLSLDASTRHGFRRHARPLAILIAGHFKRTVLANFANFAYLS
jgi:hypothetical protein